MLLGVLFLTLVVLYCSKSNWQDVDKSEMKLWKTVEVPAQLSDSGCHKHKLQIPLCLLLGLFQNTGLYRACCFPSKGTNAC